jgi:hypothetical protein
VFSAQIGCGIASHTEETLNSAVYRKDPNLHSQATMMLKAQYRPATKGLALDGPSWLGLLSIRPLVEEEGEEDASPSNGCFSSEALIC